MDKLKGNSVRHFSVKAAKEAWGTTVAKNVVKILFTFGVFNFLFFTWSVTVSGGNPASRISLSFLIALTGMLFTAIGIYYTCRYLRFYTVRLLSMPLTFLLKSLSGKAIDEFYKYRSLNSASEAEWIGKTLKSTQLRGQPRFLKKSLFFLMDNIPFSVILINMKDLFFMENKKEVKKIFSERVISSAADYMAESLSPAVITLLFLGNVLFQGIICAIFYFFIFH